MPPTRPSLPDLNTRITADVEASTVYDQPLLPRSVLRVLARVFAGAIHMLYGFASWMSAQVFPDTAESDKLDRWASIWGVTRQAATFTNCSLDATGVDGSVIPSGSLWVAGNGVEYESTDSATISSGTATAPVTATTSGVLGNVAANQAVSLVNPVAGVDGAATVDATGISNGVDAESDAALLTRLLARIQQPPQGGALADYVAWARSVAGVTRAWAFANWQGPGTVGVTLVTDDDPDGPIPSSDVLTAVSTYLGSVRPVTAAVTVFAPTAVTVPFTITMSGSTSAIRTAVEAALAAYVNESGYPGQVLMRTKMIQAIAENSGGLDFTLTSPASNLTLTSSQFGVIGAFTWH